MGIGGSGGSTYSEREVTEGNGRGNDERTRTQGTRGK